MDKQELLDAIARSGSAGKAAYEQAQQSLGAQQAEAVRMALSSGIAGQAPAGAQAELQRIISEPYQSRTAQLTQNQAAMQDWYNRLGAARGAWADQQNALQQYALEQALAQASGGGGGGGGGGGASSTQDSWYKDLLKQFGTAEIAKSAIPSEAEAAGLTQDWRSGGMSPIEAIRKYASETYGVPAGTVEKWFPESDFSTGVSQTLASVVNPRTARLAIGTIRERARTSPAMYKGADVSRARTYVSQLYPKAAKQAWRNAPEYAKQATQRAQAVEKGKGTKKYGAPPK